MSCASKLNLVRQLKQTEKAPQKLRKSNCKWSLRNKPGRKESNLKVHCLVFLTNVVGNFPFEITVPRVAVVGEGFFGKI